MISTLTRKIYSTISKHKIADVWLNTDTNHHSLHACARFSTNEVITDFFAGSTQMYPTYLTIQTGIHKHITLEPAFLQYINHSCDPNVFFDTSAMKLLCLKPIEPGDEFCFFYPSAEWEMAQPFNCHCGFVDCLKLIKGAAYLTPELCIKYRLTNFISKQLKQKI